MHGCEIHLISARGCREKGETFVVSTETGGLIYACLRHLPVVLLLHPDWETVAQIELITPTERPPC